MCDGNPDGPQLRLRDAQPEDCELLFKWANDPVVRASAFSSAPIPWDGHVEWFKQKRESPYSMILIAEDRLGINIGQVRFDWAGNDAAEIDISIDASERGAGHAIPMLLAAIERFFERTRGKSLMAIVKADNAASLSAFERAGFRRVGLVHKQGCAAVHLARERT